MRLGRERIPHQATRQKASATTDLLIFDSPMVRSMNVIGTSTTLKARPPGLPGQVDLEAVARRRHLSQLELAQHLAAVGAVTPGGIAQRQTEYQAHVSVSAARQQQPAPRPVLDLSPVDVPRAEHDVCRVGNRTGRAAPAALTAARADGSRRRPSRRGRRSPDQDPTRSPERKRCPTPTSRCGA